MLDLSRKRRIRGCSRPQELGFDVFSQEEQPPIPISIGIKTNDIVNTFTRTSSRPEIFPLGMKRKATNERAPQILRRLLKISMESRAQGHARNNPIPVARPHRATKKIRGSKMS